MTARSIARRHTKHRIASGGALLITMSAGLLAWSTRAEEVSSGVLPPVDPSWDATLARGNRRTIDFETDAGTWMSVSLTPDGAWIIFDLLGHVYRIPAAGGEAECLTQDSGVALNYQPSVSPDGRTIAFISDRGGQDNLWLMDVDGGNPRPLALDQAARFAEPSWTANGDAVLVVRRERTLMGFLRTDDRIYRIALDGQARMLVVERPSGELISSMSGPPRYSWPAASADGRYVYFGFSNFDGSDRQLRRLELSTLRMESVTVSKSPLNTLTPPNITMQLGEVGAQPSPDGRWLAFIRKVPGSVATYGRFAHEPRTALWLRSLEDGRERILVDPITPDLMGQHPPWAPRVAPGYSWSHDGRTIVFSADGGLRRVTVDTGKVEVIPFRAQVLREISQMARHKGRLPSEMEFGPHLVRWPVAHAGTGTTAYEAGGRLWIQRSGREAISIAPPDGYFPMTPSWSPDGRALVFPAFGGPRRGVLYTWSERRGLRKIPTAPGVYYAPTFSADGRRIYVYRWPPELDWQSDSPGWELQVLDPASGAATIWTRGVDAQRLSVAADGRVFFPERRGRADLVLVSVSSDGGDRREHVQLRAAPQHIAVSPDGQWLAVEQRQDIYLVPMPPTGSGGSLPIVDVKEPSAGVRRLSFDGGYFASWKNTDTLVYASGPDIRSYDVTAGQTMSAAARGRLARAVPAAAERVAFTGARIVTMHDRQVIEKGSIVVAGDRIECVGQCDVAAATRQFDVSGATIIPGLFDVHCHPHRGDPRGFITPRRPETAIYLAHGITTCFDPANGERKWSITVGDMVESGALVGPRTLSTVEPLRCGEDGVDDQNVRQVTTIEDAREHVQRKVRMGVPSIKDFRLCTRAQRQMLAVASTEANVSLTAETGDLLWNIGLIMDGHTGWEHWISIAPLYRDVTEFLGRASTHYSPNLFMSEWPHGSALDYYLSQQDLWRDDRLRTWYPWQALAARRSFSKKPLEQYMLPLIAQGAADIKHAGGYVATGGHGEVHGLGTHWEIWSLALAMTPIEALESATLDSAHFLGLEQDLGSIEAGKIADFVVLGSNPLDDIRHTLDLKYVIASGIVRDAASLDEIWPAQRPFGDRDGTVRELMRTMASSAEHELH